MAIIAASTAAVAAGVSAYSAHEQGVAAANADKQKARAAADQATSQQITMRQNMLKALSSQNAAAGVGGVGVSKANAMRQITQAQNDLITSKGGASAQISLLDSAASASRSAGDLAAVSDLAQGASSVAASGAFSAGANPPPGWSQTEGGDLSYAQQVKAGF
jgi:hypothetical protein